MTFDEWWEEKYKGIFKDNPSYYEVGLSAWQAATERAAEIVEEADWQPIALLGKDGLNNLSKAIRQQESAEVWTQEEIDRAKAEAERIWEWWGKDGQESAET